MADSTNKLLQVASQLCEHLQQNYDFVFKPAYLKKDAKIKGLLQQIEPLLNTVCTVHEPKPRQSHTTQTDESTKIYKAITWNIERGKNLPAILKSFTEISDLKNADFILLTEVDWGMARSQNLNIAAEIGRQLELYTYFAPSFFSLTRGHGVEVKVSGHNQYGLHGKAILSKYPLSHLKTLTLPNLTKVMRKRDARIGNKRVLLASHGDLRLACVHLDAYSSPRSRARQMTPVLVELAHSKKTLIAGDWNTNTHNTTHTPGLALSVLKQLISGPKKAVTQKYANTHSFFDKPLFKLLTQRGFEFEAFNEMGVSTFDLLIDAEEMGAMAAERLPMPLIKGINKLVKHFGGHIPLKLDWFAAKSLNAKEAKVVKIPKEFHLSGRPASDHHPLYCTFTLKTF